MVKVTHERKLFRDALNEALTGKTEVHKYRSFGWVHSSPETIPAIYTDLGADASARVQQLLEKHGIGFNLESSAQNKNMTRGFTRIRVPILELKKAKEEGKLAGFLEAFTLPDPEKSGQTLRDTLRQQQQSAYDSLGLRKPRNKSAERKKADGGYFVAPARAHALPFAAGYASLATEPDTLEKPSLVELLERFGGEWHLMHDMETYSPSIHESPTTVRGTFKSGQEATKTAGLLRNAGFNVEAHGAGTRSYIQLEHRYAQYAADAAWIHRPGTIPKPREEAVDFPRTRGYRRLESDAPAPAKKSPLLSSRILPREDRVLLGELFGGNWKIANHHIQPTHDLYENGHAHHIQPTHDLYEDDPKHSQKAARGTDLEDDRSAANLRASQTYSVGVTADKKDSLLSSIRQFGVEVEPNNIHRGDHLTRITLTTPQVDTIRQKAFDQLKSGVLARTSGMGR